MGIRVLIFTLLSVLLQSTVLAADATQLSESSSSSSDKSLAETPSASSSNMLAEHQYPKLVIHWDCGECSINEKVPPLIEKSYEEFLKAHGLQVSDAETAQITIVKYHQRNPGVRILAGAMAGSDVLDTKGSFRQAQFTAEDYEANAWIGMNGLCESIAKKIAQQLNQILHSKK